MYFEKKTINILLSGMQLDKQPLWGMMTPQHMAEHLAFAVRMSNGKMPLEMAIPEERAMRAKERFLDPSWAMPKLFKPVFLPADELVPLKKNNMQGAIADLFQEIDDFCVFFEKHPNAKPIHPYFGALNLQEWERLHEAHFQYHFEQFELI